MRTTIIWRYLDRIKSKRFLDNLFLFVLAVYIARVFFATTLFVVPWPWYFDKLLRIAAVSIAVLRIAYIADQETGYKWWGRIIIGVLFALSWVSTGYDFLLELPIFMIGVYNIPYKKILKVYFFCGLLIMATAAFGALTGCIEDLIYYEGEKYKHSFGIVYTTDFAAHIVYLALVFWVIYDKTPFVIMAVLFFGLSVFVFNFNGAKCSTIVLMLAMMATLYNYAINKLICKNERYEIVEKCINAIQTILIIPCSILMIVLSLLYQKDILFFEKIDSLFTGRFSLAHNAFQQYGIKLFGTAFDMIGRGGSVIDRSNYNFVDSSYCIILIRYGLVILILIYAIHIWISYKGKNKILSASLALIAIHSMIEHHYLELAYNPFLLLMFADLTQQKERCIYKAKRRKRFFYAAIVLMAVFMINRVLMYFRTIVTLLKLDAASKHIYFIGGFFVFALMIILFIRCLQDIVYLKLNGEKIKWKLFTTGGISVCCLTVFMAFCENIIRNAEESYWNSVKKGSAIIDAINKGKGAEKCMIYVEDIPELYIRNKKTPSKQILVGNGCAEKKNAIYITDKENDLYHFIDNGWIFGELSEKEGVYTNCSDAIEIIESQGIELHDYYSVKKEVDLLDLSKSNSLSVTETGGILVEGTEKSLTHGPWISIYKGTLAVEYKLKLHSTSITDGSIAKLRISGKSGDVILQEKEININDFDENMVANIKMVVDVGNMEGIEFLLFAYQDSKVEIQEIAYEKTQ